MTIFGNIVRAGISRLRLRLRVDLTKTRGNIKEMCGNVLWL